MKVGEAVLPRSEYARRLRQKRVPFLGWKYRKGDEFRAQGI